MDKNTKAQITEKEVDVYGMIGQEIDFLEYVLVILRNKYRILFVSICMATLAFIVSSFLQKEYTAHVQLAIVEPERLGGVSPESIRAPEVMTLVERGFISNVVYDNHQDRVIAKMNSQMFIQYFIEKNELLPFIFTENWDKENMHWIEEFNPDLSLATRIFKNEHCLIDINSETQLIVVGIKWDNPTKAAALANAFAKHFNEFMRTQEIQQTDKVKAFLMEELKKTKIMEMRKSIYRLMEAQLIIKMLASSKKQHTLEVLDPAVPPLEKSSPAKKKIAFFTLLGVFFFSISFLIGRVIFMKIRLMIEQYESDQVTRENKISKLDKFTNEN